MTTTSANTTTEIENNFSFAELNGSENDIKLAHKIRVAYIAWQFSLASPYIQLNDINRTDTSYWINNYSWLLKGI